MPFKFSLHVFSTPQKAPTIYEEKTRHDRDVLFCPFRERAQEDIQEERGIV